MIVDPTLFGVLVVYTDPNSAAAAKTQGRIRGVSCSSQGYHFLIERTGGDRKGFDSVPHHHIIGLVEGL